MQYSIGIDIETTGLEPEKGEIIEVAAVRYPPFEASDGRKISTFVKLCKSSRPISDWITSLTGITNEMVAEAPTFADIIPELQAFIGDSLIFAHNASFDVTWLTYNGLSLENNKVWDTFVISTVAWPEAESYNLSSLLQKANDQAPMTNDHLGRGEHSAEYDVEMAWAVLQAAQTELAGSPKTYKRIVELLERAGLGHYLPLFSTTSPDSARAGSPPLHVRGKERDEVRSAREVLGPDGPLAKHWSHQSGRQTGFIPRPEQQRMAEVVETVLDQGGVGLIEAPTGTGKTVAYLTPLLLSKPAQSKAIISMYTKHLQDQLIVQDIPQLQRALRTHRSIATLKGRRNYVCTRRLGLALERASLPHSDVWMLVRVLLWLDRGAAGDLDCLNTSHQTKGILEALHADSVVCRQSCTRQLEAACPYQRALKAAHAAEILIVNHALLADPLFVARWLIHSVVVDEAHHLERALRHASRVSLASSEIMEIISPLLQSEKRKTEDRHLWLEASHALAQFRELLETMRHFMSRHSHRPNLRLTAGIRQSSEWGKIEKRTEQWVAKCSFIIGLLEAKAGLPVLSDMREGLREFSDHLQRFVGGADTRIQWLEIPREQASPRLRPGADPISLHDVALSVSPLVRRIYGSARSVIFTSATLTTAGNFSYVKKSLGISSATEVSLPSTFNLRDNLLIYLVEDAPVPSHPDYDNYLAGQIHKIAHLLGGRTLGLFTSLRSLGAVFKSLVHPLNKGKIRLYAQGLTGGRSTMLNRFRAEAQSVLLGCDSFWEGIDIPGDTLSCVVIAKLPFTRPYDPIMEAVAEAEGITSFDAFNVPQMILKLRQGIGRLIRTSSDRGIVIIFDSRLHHSWYGEKVLKSLPSGRIKIGPSSDLIGVIREWIGDDVLESWKLETGK